MKLNLKEKIDYFKKLIWVFVLILILFNIALFYFVTWVLYFILLIVWNIALIWGLIPVFIWISKTYLVDSAFDVMNDVRSDIADKYDDDIIQVVEKK